jgi:diaminopimelate decarboxylase
LNSDTVASLPLSNLLPVSAGLSPEGHLTLGGIDALELTREFGTPLYVYDAQTVREQAAAYRGAFESAYPDSVVVYGAKAFINRPFARLIADQGLAFDAVSGGEIEVMRAAGVDMASVYFHGNNKGADELRLAAELGVGRVVIDNLDEVERANTAAAAARIMQPVLLRISPGVDAHTHEKTTTGIIDVKFGVPVATGDAETALRAIAAAPNLEFRGLHLHLGSPLFDLEPYDYAIEVAGQFIADVCRDKLGLEVQEFSPGGGFAVGYESDSKPPTPQQYADVIATSLQREADKHGFPLPHLTVEPGRAIAARAGVALYSVGSRKAIPGVRTYVSVDGGMADNIRPTLYGARYEALSAERPLAPAEEVVTVSGKYCESGDVLLKDANLPALREGEVLAVPASGAYQLSMASNYNHAYRPAVVLVDDGEARLIRRRESAEDLMSLDVD